MRMRLPFFPRLGVAILVCACASPPAVDERVPRVVYFESVNPDTSRQETVYEGPGGAILGFVRHQARRRTALVYLHGIESHAGWFDESGDMLCAEGFDVFCLDRRGSGINRENRGFASGHIDSYETYLKDIHAFVKPLRERFARIYLVGLSWGGKLALAHALTYPGDCDGLVLITPGMSALVDISPLDKIRAVTASAFAPGTGISIPLEPEMFTKTPEFLDKMKHDPLRLHEASARFFLQSRALDGFLECEMPKNDLPTLVFLAGNDEIIDNAGVRELLERGRSKPDVRIYEGQTHSIQFDAPERLVTDMVDWLDRRP